jgi:cell growth-regulating nucleolar protein
MDWDGIRAKYFAQQIPSSHVKFLSLFQICVPILVSSRSFADDYRAHTSCITEAERYEKKPLSSSNNNKKRNPQQEWMDIVESCTTTAPGHLRNYMQTMATLDNIPRKEKQFRNFTANSLNLRGKNERVVGELWKVMFEERQRRQEAKQREEKVVQQQKQEKNAANNAKNEERESSSPNNHKKSIVSSNDDEDDSDDDKNAKPTVQPSCTSDGHDDTKKPNADDFSSNRMEIDVLVVQKAMKKALKKAPNRSMKLKELRKLVGKKLSIPKSARKQLKELVLQAPSKKDKVDIVIDGKIVTLRGQQ